MHSLLMDSDDPVKYPNSGKSAHMTPVEGNLCYVISFTESAKVMNCSPTSLVLKNAFHVPHIHKLCRDNNCYMVFDTSSMCIKDLSMGAVLLRVKSENGAYHIWHNVSTVSSAQALIVSHSTRGVWQLA